MLRQAALCSGMSPDRINLVLNKTDAVNAAIDLASPGDLVGAMVYRIPRVWEALAKRQEQYIHPGSGLPSWPEAVTTGDEMRAAPAD